MSTPLHKRMLAYDYEDAERAALMAKVWAPTPWMLNVHIGDYDSKTRHEIREWLRSSLGPQASPIHGAKGGWQFGSAAIFGWEWIGFATEDQMHLFMETFPGSFEVEEPPR